MTVWSRGKGRRAGGGRHTLLGRAQPPARVSDTITPINISRTVQLIREEFDKLAGHVLPANDKSAV